MLRSVKLNAAGYEPQAPSSVFLPAACGLKLVASHWGSIEPLFIF